VGESLDAGNRKDGLTATPSAENEVSFVDLHDHQVTLQFLNREPQESSLAILVRFEAPERRILIHDLTEVLRPRGFEAWPSGFGAEGERRISKTGAGAPAKFCESGEGDLPR